MERTPLWCVGMVLEGDGGTGHTRRKWGKVGVNLTSLTLWLGLVDLAKVVPENRALNGREFREPPL